MRLSSASGLPASLTATIALLAVPAHPLRGLVGKVSSFSWGSSSGGGGITKRPFSSTRMRAAADPGSLQELAARADHSWLRRLTPDPESLAQAPNKKSRRVKSGHYVPLLPSPLPQPSLVLHSAAMASELGLSDEACASEAFTKFFSGHQAVSLLLCAEGGGQGCQVKVQEAAYAADPLGCAALPLKAWCTPYALSIMGTAYYNNCPFGDGTGYGDGRAVSIGEVVVPASARGPLAQSRDAHNPMGGDPVALAASLPTAFPAMTAAVAAAAPAGLALDDTLPRRWEMQLKGAGRTPFCRGADGRAVLRSSIREFLVSEAMFHLGVPTTRALSLVVSGSERVTRGWYSDKAAAAAEEEEDIDESDPRVQTLLKRYPPELKSQVLAALKQQMRGGGGGGDSQNPDMAVSEACAMTCRVSPSFTRIGHLDLFARRARGKGPAAEEGRSQLAAMVRHAIEREYPYLLLPPEEGSPEDGAKAAAAEEKEGKEGGGGGGGDGLSPEVLIGFLDGAAERIASLCAHWLRVGFAQGNFNGDNCLVGGRTMDYGPFGFMERYDPLFAKWTGSGSHFGFKNQPQAGFANWQVLAQSVAPLLATRQGRGGFLGGQGNLETPPELETALAACVERAAATFGRKVQDVWRAKLGFRPLAAGDEAAEGDDEALVLFGDLNLLLESSGADFTIFFRNLALVVEAAERAGAFPTPGAGSSGRSVSDAALLAPLRLALANDPNEATAAAEAAIEAAAEKAAGTGSGEVADTGAGASGNGEVSDAAWCGWLRRWLRALACDAAGTEGKEGQVTTWVAARSYSRDDDDAAAVAAAAAAAASLGQGVSGGGETTPAAQVAARLRSVNPKFVAREWMLVDAYTAAAAAPLPDYAPVLRLHEVLSAPYDEQDADATRRFFRRNFEGEKKGGVAFMT